MPVDQLRVLWWRRLNQSLYQPAALGVDPIDVDYLLNEWRHGIEGAVRSRFRGVWVSNPDAQRRAENKILQLDAAKLSGLPVPATLVTSEPKEVRRFCAEMGGTIIAKQLRGSSRRATNTVKLTYEDLGNDLSISACPTIYQQLLGGHDLRAHVFGQEVLTVAIESQELDWRRNLNVSFRPYSAEPALADLLVSVVRRMGLIMGVIDLKLLPNGDVYWLEINPQGQFLFAEALSGVPLLAGFTDFIARELHHADDELDQAGGP